MIWEIIGRGPSLHKLTEDRLVPGSTRVGINTAWRHEAVRFDYACALDEPGRLDFMEPSVPLLCPADVKWSVETKTYPRKLKPFPSKLPWHSWSMTWAMAIAYIEGAEVIYLHAADMRGDTWAYQAARDDLHVDFATRWKEERADLWRAMYELRTHGLKVENRTPAPDRAQPWGPTTVG